MSDLKLQFLAGIDQTPYAVGASDIKNMRYDPSDLCWKNDRAYTSWDNPDDPTATEPATAVVHSIYSYQKHKSALHSMLFEEVSGATLSLKAVNGPDTVTLRTGRSIPESNDPGTQYCRIGKFLFILNGENEPLLYQGGNRIRKAFFDQRPEAPIPHPVPSRLGNTFGSQTAGTLQKRKRLGKAGITIFDGDGNLGMGPSPEFINDPVTAAQEIAVPTTNSYQYAVTFVTDTGAESQISEASANISWHLSGGVVRTVARTQYKFGISLTGIPLGPEGTVKRRLYRTRNQRDGLQGAGGVFYFLADIPDNVTTSWYDIVPDSELGAEAPSVSESAPFPKGVSLITAFKNHLIVAGAPETPSVLHFSKANFPEQFPAFNFFDVGDREGGAITGLYGASNVCYIFRENAIDILVPTQNLDLPFKVVPFATSVGSLSPNSIAEVPGVGVVFLGSDKSFYAIQPRGNYEGGAQLVDISTRINRLTDDISANALARVYGIYSERDKEYWATCPVNGDRYASRGYVFHATPKSWSTRRNIPAGCFTYIPEGWVVFGSNSTDSNLPIIDGTDESAVNLGLMVWCGARGVGYTDPGGQEDREATTGTQEYIYETTWLNLGDQNVIKHVKGLTLFCWKNVAGGGTMRVGVDWKPLVYENSEVLLDTTFDTYNSEQTTAGLYGTAVADDPFNSGNVKDVDKNRYSAREIVQVRIDNAMASYQNAAVSATRITPPPSLNSTNEMGSGGNRWFKFKFSGSEPIALIGFAVHFEVSGTMKQLNFAAGSVDSRDTLMSIMGL